MRQPPRLLGGSTKSDTPDAGPDTDPASRRVLRCTVNGRSIAQPIDASSTLAEVIRDGLELRGTKVACDQASCGACTVLVDGQAAFACHTLAAQVEGAAIETIEGLGDGDALHPLQTAFIEHDALQCGYCTPGMIMALKGALDAGAPPDRATLARSISGNLCRCGAYQHILDAAMSVAASQ